MSDSFVRSKKTLFDTDTNDQFESLARKLGVRKIVTNVEETLVEGQRGLTEPLKQVATAIILRNPWVSGSASQDLQPETERIAPVLAKLAVDRIVRAIGSVEEVEAFGKGAIVGLNGELEHGGALIHTPFFGNIVRELLDGSSIMCFSDQRSAVGAELRVPMWHKTAAATRSHYQSMSISVADAPMADELMIIVACSNGSRPNHRIGDRTTDKAVSKDILKGIEL